MIVTTGGRGESVSGASSAASVSDWAAYSSSRTASKPKADAISSIWSKSSRWFTVTMRPSSLNANWTIWVAGTFIAAASSDTEMNSLTRIRVFSLSRSSAIRPAWTSRNDGSSGRRPLRPGLPFMPCSVRRMFACTASWSTIERLPFFPFLRPPPFSASGPKVRAGGAPPWPGRAGGPPGRDGGPPERPGAAGALLLKTGLGPRGLAGGRWMRGGMNGARVASLGVTRRGGEAAVSAGWAVAAASPAGPSLYGSAGAGGRSLKSARARSSRLCVGTASSTSCTIGRSSSSAASSAARSDSA